MHEAVHNCDAPNKYFDKLVEHDHQPFETRLFTVGFHTSDKPKNLFRNLGPHGKAIVVSSRGCFGNVDGRAALSKSHGGLRFKKYQMSRQLRGAAMP